MGKFLNNFFGFTKQQRNGLFVLILISLALLSLRLTYPIFIKPDNIVVLDLPLIEQKLDSAYSASRPYSKSHYQKESPEPSVLFVFDPNKVSLEQLLQLGFKEKTAQVLLKFRSKGFVFKERNDLKKVYGISERFFTKLEPYILIAETATKQSPEKTQDIKSAEKPVTIATKQVSAKTELNSADSSSLVSINGIGPGYSKRILKYRTILGGYTSVEQLKEVYGFTEDVYEKVKGNFYVEAKNIRKINLNKDDFKVINKHPYLTYEITKTIFDWRRKTTITPTNLKDILNDAVLYQKLLPYLSFE